MNKRKFLKTNLLIVLFTALVLVCGCTQAVKKDQWTCFYQEEGKDKQCRNFYDESFTRLLKDNISSISFVQEEFKGDYSVEKLCKAIKADGYDISVKVSEDSLAWLNAVLKTPNLQRRILEKKDIMPSSPEIRKLDRLTMKHQNKRFEDLDQEQQNNIMRLNRLILKALYEKECPAPRYVIAVRTKLIGNDEEKKEYLKTRKNNKASLTGYEDLQYSIFEIDIDCVRSNYRIQGQFDYNSKQEKLDGQAFPFSRWMNIDQTTESIFQRECRPDKKLEKAN